MNKESIPLTHLTRPFAGEAAGSEGYASAAGPLWCLATLGSEKGALGRSWGGLGQSWGAWGSLARVGNDLGAVLGGLQALFGAFMAP